MAIRRRGVARFGQAKTKWRTDSSDSQQAFMPAPIKLFIGLLNYKCEVGNFSRGVELKVDDNA